MAIRLFRSRSPKEERKDPTRLAAVGKPASDVRIVRSHVDTEPAIVDTIAAASGSDPYNSTGRFLADKIRQRRYE